MKSWTPQYALISSSAYLDNRWSWKNYPVCPAGGPGVCCAPVNNECTSVDNEMECEAIFGTYVEGANCFSGPCDNILGACCTTAIPTFPGITMCEKKTFSECDGDWNNATCENAICSPLGACCDSSGCNYKRSYLCTQNGAIFEANTTCPNSVCGGIGSGDPGACCDSSDNCTFVDNVSDCINGTFTANAVCVPNPCVVVPPPVPGDCCDYFTGPCCFIGQPCIENTTPTDCNTAAGIFLGFNRTCEDCTGSGACCADICYTANSQILCENHDGVWKGPGTSCINRDQCPP